MPALDNRKHELFCHIIAAGNPPRIAWIGMGHARKDEAAEKFAQQPRIKKRIEEIESGKARKSEA